MTSRYAVYYAPEDGTALAGFGWPWLGRRPDSEAYGDAPCPALVAEARLYGFHGTLKAPFRLAEGQSRDTLVAALDDFAASRPGFTLPPLRLGELRGFLSLRPAREAPAMDAFAFACVTTFERFRAPLDAAEMAKRLQVPLSARQQELLRLWGYPYVADQFEFHLTLTRSLDAEERRRAIAMLESLVAPLHDLPQEVRSVCLFEQAAPGRPFVLGHRSALSGARSA